MRRLPIVESRSAVPIELPETPPDFATDGSPVLEDAQGRAYTYLRLSVTDRCDLACVYCMPVGGEAEHGVRDELLSFEEVARLVRVVTQAGIRRLRITGGEPLVRRDIVRLVDLVARTTSIDEIVMTTNGTRLAELAKPLREAGLSSVNVSIDSLDRARFERITRGGDLGRVLAGIHAALDVGLRVKLNTVPLRGENDDELGAIVDYAWSIGAVPRFIELMPLGEGAHLPASMRIDAAEVRALLGGRLASGSASSDAGHGPARYVAAARHEGRRVGFITPWSDEFCGECNRIRVTARGDLRACLASRRAVSLRDILRAGGSDRDVLWALTWALGAKADGHFFRDAGEREHEHVGMSLIGG